MHSSEILLNRLEKTTHHTQSWIEYVLRRSPKIQKWIDTLRKFAAKKPGKVADSCNLRANKLQERLDTVLAFKGKR